MANSGKKKILKHLSKAGMGLISVSLLLGSALPAASAIDSADAASKALGAEGSKEVLNQTLKAGRSKPGLSLAAGITCIACIPVAGAGASPGLCITCGILIAKTLGS